MENLWNYIRKTEKPIVHFPPDEIEKWKRLKDKYFSLGYKWLDFTSDYSIRKIRRYDNKNAREYNKRKNYENKMRNSFKGPGNIPIVYPPPAPTNWERYEMLLRWSKNDNYNISMITFYLYTRHGLKPCDDYEPDNIIRTYNNYCQRHALSFTSPVSNNFPVERRISYENTIRRESCNVSRYPPSLPPPPRNIELKNNSPSAPPSLPPPPRNIELKNSSRSAPPSYTQLSDQLA